MQLHISPPQILSTIFISRQSGQARDYLSLDHRVNRAHNPNNFGRRIVTLDTFTEVTLSGILHTR